MEHSKYPVILRLFHWISALVIIGLLIAGFYMVSMPDSNQKWQIFALHKSLGVTLLGLVALRICVRLVSHTPRLPSSVHWFEMLIEKLTHLGLYGFMIAMPLSGYMMSTMLGHPVSWFGYPLPELIGKNEELGKLMLHYHQVFAYVIIGLVALHFIGFLKHLIVNKENFLKRIW